MRKRLKKKLHKGLFKEYGFYLSAKYKEGEDFDKISDDLLEFLEQNKMYCGGGVTPDLSVFITVGTKDLDPEEKRLSVIAWCESSSDIVSHQAGQLLDCWNSPENDNTKHSD